MAPYILTKPIHGSQKKISESEKGVKIEIEVIPNYELKQLLLSYGANVEIISPETYRNEIAASIKEMNRKYNG